MIINRSGFTGQRVKPLLDLPNSLLRGFEEALLAKVNVTIIIFITKYPRCLIPNPFFTKAIIDHQKKPRQQQVLKSSSEKSSGA